MYRKPKAWRLDFDGVCLWVPYQKSFSVGVFRWIPTADGKRLKRAPVFRRFRGDDSKYRSDIVTEAEKFIRCLERAEKNPHCGGK